MAGSAKNWLIGCGIGCGLLVALGLGLGAAGWYGVKHVAKRAEGLEAARDSLALRFGPPERYAPPADGRLAPERVEAFLEARDLMASARERASHTLAVLDGSSGSSVPERIAAGVNFVPQLMSFIEERDRALLRAGMGAGEYQFLYTVAFFGLLGKDPGDGPGFAVVSGGDGEGSGHDWTFGSRHESGGQDDAERVSVQRERAQAVREELNRCQRENLRRQLAALDNGSAGGGAGRGAWRAALAAEVAALDQESRRFAWEKGLPEALRASLEPFRDRLAASYDAMTGVLELRFNSPDDLPPPVEVRTGDGV